NLNDITRQLRRARNDRHRRRGEGPGGGIQRAIRSRIQINAWIRRRRSQRALRQEVALPTALHVSRTLYQRGRGDRVAPTVRDLVDQQSAALSRVSRRD